MNLKTEIYKCTVHDKYQDCSAIDYMVHNLDHSTDILLNIQSNVNKEKIQEKEISVLHQIFRRLYRILAHAKVFHETVFNDFEQEMFLYKRFFQFCKEFDINQKDKLLPPNI